MIAPISEYMKKYLIFVKENELTIKSKDDRINDEINI
jgi:hypothetical protein